MYIYTDSSARRKLKRRNAWKSATAQPHVRVYSRLSERGMCVQETSSHARFTWSSSGRTSNPAKHVEMPDENLQTRTECG